MPKRPIQQKFSKHVAQIWQRVPRTIRPFVIGTIGLCLVLVPQKIGIGMIVVYAIIVFLCNIPSRITLIPALAALSLMPLAVQIKQQIIAQNLGAYSFLLFVIAIIGLCTELIREAKAMQTK